MRHANRSRRWRLPLWGACLLLVFSMAALGQPEVSSADPNGCAETVTCASMEVCEDWYGDACKEGDCHGVTTCVPEEHGECADTVCENPGVDCEVVVCVDVGPE